MKGVLLLHKNNINIYYLLTCIFFHSSPDGTGDVLNDIGNMLANLTDELDAMLEQEVILKN